MGSALTDQLDALLQGQRTSVEADLKVILAKLATEVRARVNKGSPASYDFFSSALRSLARVRGSAHADVRMACLFDCASFFMANRNIREALECGKQVELIARKAGDKRWIRKGLMLQGIMYGLLGDCGEAVAKLSTALTLVRELDEPGGEVSVLTNLGSTLNYAGLYREAIPCFTKAMGIAQSRSECPPYYEGSALCNLAQSYFYLGYYQRGFAAISKALTFRREPEDAFSALALATREYTFVQLSLELGKISLARQHTQICYGYALLGGAKTTFLADLCSGLCEIHGGNVQRGVAVLEKAVASSDEKGSVEYIDALNALVKAYDHSLQPEKALDRMTDLIATIRTRRERSIESLASLDSSPLRRDAFASEDSDLSAMTTRHAQLRTLVAEHEVACTRAEVLERFAVTADLREEASGEHGYRVGRLAYLIAERLLFSRDVCVAIEYAARLHDIGKIAVPDRILLASKQLQDAERHFVATHTSIGAELLGKSNIPQLRMAEEIARHHHEWWNGEGYPSKLKGKRIPIHARIVALADVFDALTHGRPFSPPWPIDKALDEIRGRKGTQFDPELTDLFLELIDQLRKDHPDLDAYLGQAGRNSPFLQARNRIRQMLADEREYEKKANVAGNETRH